MSKNTSAVDREKAESSLNRMSEYKIGHTTYLVRTIFNPVYQESISHILKRLIIRECKKNAQSNRTRI